MFSLCHSKLAVALCLLCGALAAHAEERVLRVCADPNNLPFSNREEQGFENRIAAMLAREMNSKLEYRWWPQRESAVKLSLDRNECDVLMGVPSGVDSVLTTEPYYRSTYVFVSRTHRDLNLTSLLDERFAEWKIGVHVVGQDFAPPAQALARRGLSANLVGFSLFGKEGERDPPARLIQAVASGEVDVAIAWGPLAGYFAKRESEPLTVTPVSPAMFLAVPFTFQISAAVRKADTARKAELDKLLAQKCSAIQELLLRYGVPLLKEGQTHCDNWPQSGSALSR